MSGSVTHLSRQIYLLTGPDARPRSYDRYWMGRTVWSDVLRNSRTLSRLIWFHVPLRLAPEDKDSKQDDGKAEAAKQVMAEKRLSLDLIEA